MPPLNIRKNAIAGVLEPISVGLAYFVSYAALIRVAGADDVGVWSLLLVALSVARLADLKVGDALLHYVPHCEARGHRAGSVAYIETATLIVTAVFVVLCLLGLAPLRWIMHAVIPAHKHALLEALLPFALVSMFATNVGSVSMSALGSTQRMFARNLIQIAGSLTMMGVTLALVHEWGVIAAGWGLAAQSIVVMAAGWFVLRASLPELTWIPRKLGMAEARTMFDYGLRLQVVSLALFFLEPVTRLLLGRFASLADVTYFSLAWRLVSQVRGVIFSAVFGLVPAFGLLASADPGRRDALYARTNAMMFGLGPPLLAAAAAIAPLAAELLIGTRSDALVAYSVMLSFGWLAATVNLGPYIRALGEGRARWNIYGHVATAMLNVTLAPVLAWRWGGIGAAFGAALALGVGSLIVMAGNHRSFGGRILDLFDGPALRVLAVSWSALAVDLWLYDTYRDALGYWAVAGMMLVCGLGLVCGALWLHPVRHTLQAAAGRRPLDATGDATLRPLQVDII